MTPEERAARITALRAVLDITEAHPEIPLPGMSTHANSITWTLWRGDPAPQMAYLEKALGCELATGVSRSGDTDWLELKGTLAGFEVKISARAADVAERKVTGTRTVEDVDWVRRPVAPEGTEGQ